VTRRAQTLIWIGLFAAPSAFIVEHVAGWLISEGDCSPVSPLNVNFSAAVAVITLVAALAAAGGIAASLAAYRSVRGTDNDAPPPPGRIWLLSICGIVVSSLLFVLIVLGGSGALLLGDCAQAQPPEGIVRPGNEAGLSDTELGSQLYAGNCASCHGISGQGVPRPRPSKGSGNITEAGPPLRGVGALAADFYLRTGYMPLRKPDEQPWRHRVLFNERELRALIDYVASLGPGPDVPKPAPEHGHLGEGLRLFTQHCAGCHQVVGEGGYVPDARVPRLKEATPTQIAEAVRIGPYLMPRFSEKAISKRQLDSIVAYVEASKKPRDRGGWGIGHIGPVPEGMVAWFIAAVVLVGLCALIGERLRS
jgi:ubiquinol-cytochrome c reductase cytochrome c subunit